MLSQNVDQLLDLASKVAWVLFAVYAVVFFARTIWLYGIVTGIIRLFSFRVLVPLLLVIGINLLSLALVFVQPQQVGVVVSIISPGGIRPQPLRAGLHLIIPFLETEVLYPISWQTYTMSIKPMEGSIQGDDSIRARTSDGQEVRLSASVIFRVDQEQAISLHIDWQNRYIEEFVRPFIRGLVRTIVSQYEVREVNSDQRADLEILLDRLIREEFAQKGLVMDQFLLRDIAFSPEYSSAVEAKQVAFEERVQTEYQAEQMRNLAGGRADAIELEAQAQSNALKLIGDALEAQDDLVTYHYVDKIAPNVRVMLLPSDNPLILPMPSLDAMAPITDSVPLTTTMSPATTAPAPSVGPSADSKRTRLNLQP